LVPVLSADAIDVCRQTPLQNPCQIYEGQLHKLRTLCENRKSLLKNAALAVLIGAPEEHDCGCESGGFPAVLGLTCGEIRYKDGKSGLCVYLSIMGLKQEYEHGGST
jgi:hypothetical protein